MKTKIKGDKQMKHTKQNIIKALNELKKNDRALANYYEEKGDKETAGKYRAEARWLYEAIEVLTDKDFFNKVCEIFKLEEDR